jgi:drug/metabolite transporter (DMT)-like permease
MACVLIFRSSSSNGPLPSPTGACMLACYTIYDVTQRGGPLPFTGLLKRPEPGAPLIDFRRHPWSKATGALTLALVLLIRASSNMYAARFTEAFIVQLLNMLTPVFASLAAHYLMKTPLPDKLVPTLSLMTVGSALTVIGGVAMQSQRKYTGWDFIGILLGLISSIALAAYMLAVQKTKGVLLESEVL